MFWRTLVCDSNGIKGRFSVPRKSPDDRSRRCLLTGAERLALGRGGISAVSRAIGRSRAVIRQGVAKLKARKVTLAGRGRANRGGVRRLIRKIESLHHLPEAAVRSKVVQHRFSSERQHG